MTGRDSRYKTQAYKDWSYQVFHYLSSSQNLQALEDLRDFFDKSKHVFCIEMITYYPEEVLITKKGTISSRAFDTTNVEKPLIDLLFDPSYFTKAPPYGCPNLNTDDKHLLDMHSKKRISNEFKIELNISIVDRNILLERHILNNEN